MNKELMKKMLAAGAKGMGAETLNDSIYFGDKDIVPTALPALNIAFSGDIAGGMVSGITVIAGPSKSFKSLLSLFCMKAYFDKYKDAICLFYDSEFGTPPAYLAAMGIDTKRIIHIPVEHLEQLKFDLTTRLAQVERGDKVFVFIDSLGNLASKKEVEDALDEKSVADMTRAKAIRGLLRIVSAPITKKDLPMVIVAHSYQEMSLFPKSVVGGGTALIYFANQVFMMGRQQEKGAEGIEGYNFIMNVEKSRFVKEKSKIPIQVMYEGGIQKYTGLLDIAIELGFVKEGKAGRGKGYTREGLDTDKVWTAEEAKTDEFWKDVLTRTNFNEAVKKRYQVGTSKLFE